MSGRGLWLAMVALAGAAVIVAQRTQSDDPPPLPTKDPSVPPADPLPKIPQVALGRTRLIGDSLGVGLAPPLAKLLGSFDGQAITSTRTAQWSKWGERLNVGGNARVVLIVLGTNDIASSVHPDAFRADVAHLVKVIRMGNSKVGWIAPPNLPWPGTELRAVLSDELGRAKCPLFDSRIVSFERAGDKIHATPKGYATWAAAIAAWLPSAGLRAT